MDTRHPIPLAVYDALQVALPYVEKVAATAPTEARRMERQRRAVQHVAQIKAALAARPIRTDDGVMIDANRGWLRLNRLIEFQQFAAGRITRTPFPLGGYVYTTSDNRQLPFKEVYSGNDYVAARKAVPVS